LRQYPLDSILPHMENALSPIVIMLREARDAAGLTQVELARKADVRQATISELENGNTRRIDFDVLDRLCRALRLEPGDLLKRKAR
jgi:DNA-binding Xre family transcriptional regulator